MSSAKSVKKNNKMPKEIVDVVLERDNTKMKWGISLQGGQDLSLTSKIATVRAFTPASVAGLEKMDYIHKVNDKVVFGMSQPAIAKLIEDSGVKMTMQVERGDHIVPSFDEIWPKERIGKDGKKLGKELKGMDYYLDAMQNHGLGFCKQPDNFTTCGRLNIEVNQYNNPVECYDDGTIEDMRDEKILMECPDQAERIIQANAKKAAENPAMKQAMKARNFDPKKSDVLMAISAQEKRSIPNGFGI